MQRFRGIEGARGWLSWIVVIGHLIVVTRFGAVVSGSSVLVEATGHAVSVFIVISGFVICHLLVSDPEPYRTYLVRRWLRIYPVYFVCLMIGVAVLLILARFTTYTQPLDFDETLHYAHQLRELDQGRFVPHLLLDLTLLQGMVPNNLLDEAPYMFLGTSWTLSLEWQFYLVAPLVIAAMRRPGWNIVAVLAIGFGVFAFQRGDFGMFFTPSILLAAGIQFAIGIVTRLAIDRLPALSRFPWLPVVGLALAACFLPRTAYLVGWVVIVAYIKLTPAAFDRDRIARLVRAALDSRFVRALGRRSYPVYLLHAPVLAVVAHAGFAGLHLDGVPLLLFTAVVGLSLTALGAELLHRFVERPGIALGHRFSAPRAAAPPSTEPAKV
jgi:peptidoglycan/LPS O-acetylase OafA/YrhL